MQKLRHLAYLFVHLGQLLFQQGHAGCHIPGTVRHGRLGRALLFGQRLPCAALLLLQGGAAGQVLPAKLLFPPGRLGRALFRLHLGIRQKLRRLSAGLGQLLPGLRLGPGLWYPGTATASCAASSSS